MPIRHILVVTGDHELADDTKWSGGFSPGDLELHQAMREALESLRWSFEFCSDHAALVPRLQSDPPDLVFNLCDTGFGNVATRELHIPALCEVFGVPYTGAGPTAMTLCYDKSLVRLIAADLGLAVPDERSVGPLDSLGSIETELEFPALIKPAHGDGSVGINRGAVVRSIGEARRQLAWFRKELPGRIALVQEYLPGPEYGLALIGNPGSFHALSAAEVDFSKLGGEVPPILAFESKTGPENPYDNVSIKPARLPGSTREGLVRQASLLFERLECRDYARFDYRTGEDGGIKLMEVNPNPAWSKAAKLAIMASFEGVRYPQLLEMLIETAITRITPG